MVDDDISCESPFGKYLMSTSAITNCTQCGLKPLTRFSCKQHLELATISALEHIRLTIYPSSTMKTFIYFLVLSEVLKNCEFHIAGEFANSKQTFLMKTKANEIFLRRSKRYLVFEKGATFTVQGNIAKSIIPPAPRGLNVIAEYTLNYELPSDLQPVFQRKQAATTRRPVSSTTVTTSHTLPYHLVPYSHDYLIHMHPDANFIQRKFSQSQRQTIQSRCFERKFYDYKRQYSNICLSRGKRHEVWSFSQLTVSQRMFYDVIEKWSLLHDFLPRYCFMRTLCESSEFLLPYGDSLLHDIIHILLRYTKPWAFHHKIFGRSLRQRYSIDECAKLYGLYCPVSWLDFVTKAVHGSRAADFKR